MATIFLDDRHPDTNCAMVSFDPDAARVEFHKALAAGTDTSLIHPMLGLSHVYQAVALSCRDKALTADAAGELQLSTIFPPAS